MMVEADLLEKIKSLSGDIKEAALGHASFLRRFEEHADSDIKSFHELTQIAVAGKVSAAVVEERAVRAREMVEELRQQVLKITDLEREITDLRITMVAMRELAAERKANLRILIASVAALASLLGASAALLFGH